jgi:hypothetical protein
VAPFVRVQLGGTARRGDDAVDALLQHVRHAVVRAAQPRGRLDERVEDDLQIERGPGHDPQDLVDRDLLLERVALQVAEPLLGQRGLDPGAQDLRVDRLGQVVRGAHPDAPDDAVRFVDARDDDDRQVAQPDVCLECLEGLIAVHLGHHDVQQDHVDRVGVRIAQEVQRLPPVDRLGRLMADRRQEADQQPAVERGVVDDEDAAAAHAPASGAAGTVASPVPMGWSWALCAWTSASASASGRMGFEM